MTTTSRKLTALDLEVLRAAARNDGSLWRSESGYPMYSYLAREGAGRNNRKNVTSQVHKLAVIADPALLAPGEREAWTRPWLLTDAGRDALNTADRSNA